MLALIPGALRLLGNPSGRCRSGVNEPTTIAAASIPLGDRRGASTHITRQPDPNDPPSRPSRSPGAFGAWIERPAPPPAPMAKTLTDQAEPKTKTASGSLPESVRACGGASVPVRGGRPPVHGRPAENRPDERPPTAARRGSSDARPGDLSRRARRSRRRSALLRPRRTHATRR